MSPVHWTHSLSVATLVNMTTTQNPQPTSLDQRALAMVPVVLGGPSLPRPARARRTRRDRAVAIGTPVSQVSGRDRLSIPR